MGESSSTRSEWSNFRKILDLQINIKQRFY